MARVAKLIERRFEVTYTLRAVSYLLHRMGYSLQVPARRAVERDERAITTWHRRRWPAVKRLAAARGAWICFQDEAGQTLRPPRSKTWARRGRTPVVTVSGKGSGRISIAGLVCLKPGHRGRLMWRTRLHRGRHGERGSFSEDDYIAFLDQAHQRLQAPIVVVWDNVNTHISVRMRTLIAARHWLTVIRLPAYAPELNPTEGVWSWTKRGITNIAVHGVDHLAHIVKQRLRACQQQSDLIAGFLAQTGMTLEPELP